LLYTVVRKNATFFILLRLLQTLPNYYIWRTVYRVRLICNTTVYLPHLCRPIAATVPWEKFYSSKTVRQPTARGTLELGRPSCSVY